MRLDVEEYHELARPFFGVSLQTPLDAFFVDVAFYHHDRLVMTEVEFSNQKIWRKPHHIRQFDTNILLVETYKGGSCRGLIDDETTFVDANSIHIMDWSRDYTALMQDAAVVGLQIPHALVGYDPSRHPAYLSLPLKTPRGRLLAFTLDLLVGQMRDGETRDVEHLASAMLAQMRSLILSDGEEYWEDSSEKSRRSIIESFVQKNIARSDLSPDRICRELGMSRATLYRTFGKNGIDHYIREQRLENCCNDLLRSPNIHGAVHRVAERWGFYDASNFRRSFRAKFGVSPSECLSDDTLRSRGGQVYHPVLDWMRKPGETIH
ncbi:helix-turn-helix domain-containing protein [Ruegeria sp. 2205SS24-7]|uniref:helix-turn-helix domain-containing protein n=1 Tax=Ruegeria discodermiae TaxID=3064389 RepID=UPI00274087F6|nr:helix-turn-helix domain-containing protein [Ruegeria sp. 2205SS24-7]MDP5220573.1 helix-turn-helix domain-containing protein [Ruegeria sp. 2205SS24-7]